MNCHSAIAFAIAMALVAAPAPARAEEKHVAKNVPLIQAAEPAPAQPEDAPAPERPASAIPFAADYGRFGIELGLRGVLVGDRGFDPYSESNLSNQSVIGLSWVPITSGRFALALTGEWNYGRKEALARGDSAALIAHRLSLGVQGRVHVVNRLYAFVEIAPAALALRGSIEDAGLDRPLISNAWTFGLDTSAGAAVLLGTAHKSNGDPAVRFWLNAEVGYSFALKADMVYSVEEDDEDPRTYGSVTLPSVRFGGPIGKLAFALSF